MLNVSNAARVKKTSMTFLGLENSGPPRNVHEEDFPRLLGSLLELTWFPGETTLNPK